ncbi:MAG: radical SAM protein [Lachnospiraceae bacterium]|nr:radical SAM protein [Lachnospiraceae bacterium]
MHYNGPIVRPPMDGDSIFVEVTVGCTHNSCTFCNFYEGYPFRVAPLSQVESDLKEASRYYRKGRSKVWASGGNPFALSTQKLIELGKLFRKYLPDCKIMTYARVDDMRRKSVEDIKSIIDAGFHDIVIGVESGDDKVLSSVNKGYDAEEILEALGKLDQAGMKYRIIYLGGLAGKNKGEESARVSADVINQIHPHLMLLTMVDVLPGTTMYKQWKAGEFEPESELEKIKEYRELVANLNNHIVVQGQSASSSLQFEAKLPEEKKELLKYLDQVINTFTDEDEKRISAMRARMTRA